MLRFEKHCSYLDYFNTITTDGIINFFEKGKFKIIRFRSFFSHLRIVFVIYYEIKNMQIVDINIQGDGKLLRNPSHVSCYMYFRIKKIEILCERMTKNIILS